MQSSLPQKWIEHDKKIRPYVWSHRILGLFQSGLGLFLFFYLLLTFTFTAFEGFLASRIEVGYWLWVVYFGSVGLAWKLLTLPYAFLHFMIEKKYQLSKQSVGSWLWDMVKGLLVGGVLGMAAMGLLYASVLFFPNYWWLIACVLFFLFSIVLAQLAPILLIPLFFKLKPMDPSPLKERLLALCARFKIDVKDVYHLGMGEKTEKGNAAFVGLGKTKRILIGDTMYEKYPEDQVEAVFAHELGHQVHNDIWKGILLGVVFMVISFFLSHWICETYLYTYFDTQVMRPVGLMLFFAALSLVQMPLGVLQSMHSRSREYAADGFALEKISVGAPLAAALEQLTYQNWGYFKPHPLVEFLTYSHPAPWRRIVRLGQSETG